MADCLFCKITAGEIPCYKVYEDANVLAFLDIHPCAKGHTVVVPKQHFISLLDMNTELFALLTSGLLAVVNKVQMVLQPDGLNIGINNGSAAGQAVPHVHWHIIPRWVDDGGGSLHSIIKNPGAMPVAEIAKLFFN